MFEFIFRFRVYEKYMMIFIYIFYHFRNAMQNLNYRSKFEAQILYKRIRMLASTCQHQRHFEFMDAMFSEFNEVRIENI